MDSIEERAKWEFRMRCGWSHPNHILGVSLAFNPWWVGLTIELLFVRGSIGVYKEDLNND